MCKITLFLVLLYVPKKVMNASVVWIMNYIGCESDCELADFMRKNKQVNWALSFDRLIRVVHRFLFCIHLFCIVPKCLIEQRVWLDSWRIVITCVVSTDRKMRAVLTGPKGSSFPFSVVVVIALSPTCSIDRGNADWRTNMSAVSTSAIESLWGVESVHWDSQWIWSVSLWGDWMTAVKRSQLAAKHWTLLVIRAETQQQRRRPEGSMDWREKAMTSETSAHTHTRTETTISNGNRDKKISNE